MFTDDARCRVWSSRREAFGPLRNQTPAVFAEAARMCERSIGSNPLNLMNLVWLGVTYAADRTKSFANILTVTFKILADAPNSPLGKLAPEPELPHPPGRSGRRLARKAATKRRSKHHPGGNKLTQVTEEAFVQARAHASGFLDRSDFALG